MEAKIDNNVKLFIGKLKKMPDFDRVKFVFLFGSQTNGKANNMSDYDFAIYYDGDDKERYKFRIKAQFSKKFDVQIYQDLPLFVQKEVLKGKVIFCKDKNLLFEVAYETIKKFESYKRYYYDYIGLERIQ